MDTNKEQKQWNVHEALVYIQTNLNAPKNLFNKFGGYKYRNLEGITDALKPFLKETGCTFVITDGIVSCGDRVYIEAIATLKDSNGKTEFAKGFAREEENKKGMDSSQITGSTSSYARKYAANGLFAIDDTKDADATNTHGKSDESKKTSPTQPQTQDKPQKKETPSNAKDTNNKKEHPKKKQFIKLIEDGKMTGAILEKAMKEYKISKSDLVSWTTESNAEDKEKTKVKNLIELVKSGNNHNMKTENG